MGGVYPDGLCMTPGKIRCEFGEGSRIYSFEKIIESRLKITILLNSI
jgi:hypothetical protein